MDLEVQHYYSEEEKQKIKDTIFYKIFEILIPNSPLNIYEFLLLFNEICREENQLIKNKQKFKNFVKIKILIIKIFTLRENIKIFIGYIEKSDYKNLNKFNNKFKRNIII